jgi:hypothetical protein
MVYRHNNAGPKFGIQLFDPAQARAVEALSPDGELMTSLDLLHIPTPWHNSVVQLAGSDVILVTKAKLARAALAAGNMTGGLAETEGGRAYFSLQKKNAAAAPTVAEVVEVNGTKNSTVKVTVTVQAKEEEVPVKMQRRTTFSEKADAVVTAVTRRNTGSVPAGEPSWPAKGAKQGSWLGRLRWLLSLFWPRTL